MALKLRDLKQQRAATGDPGPAQPEAAASPVAQGEPVWLQQFDPVSRGPYYWNRETGDSVTWRPRTFVPGGTDARCDAALTVQCMARCWFARRRVREREEARRQNLWVRGFDPRAGQFYYHNAHTGQFSYDLPPDYIGGGVDARMEAALVIQGAVRTRVARRETEERRAMVRSIEQSGPLAPHELEQVIVTDERLHAAQDRLLDLKLVQAPDALPATLALQVVVREAAAVMDEFSELSPRSCYGISGRLRIKAALDRVVAAGEQLEAAVEAANYHEDRIAETRARTASSGASAAAAAEAATKQVERERDEMKKRRVRTIPGLHVDNERERAIAAQRQKRAELEAQERAAAEARRAAEEAKAAEDAEKARIAEIARKRQEAEAAERAQREAAAKAAEAEAMASAQEEAARREAERRQKEEAEREAARKAREAEERAALSVEARAQLELTEAVREREDARNRRVQRQQQEEAREAARRADRRAQVRAAKAAGRAAFVQRCNEWWQRGRELRRADEEWREKVAPEMAAAQAAEAAEAAESAAFNKSLRGRRLRDSPDDYASLWAAARAGCTLATLEALIQIETHRQWHHRGHKWHVDDRDQETGENLLHIAAWWGYTDLLLHVLDLGASVHTLDSTTTRMTPLHDAARAGHADVVQILLERNSRVLAQDYNGDTCLHWAARKGHFSVVQTLLRSGPEDGALSDYRVRQLVNTRNARHRRAADVASSPAIIKLFEEYAAAVERADDTDISRAYGKAVSRANANRLGPVKRRGSGSAPLRV